jgi:hypothetical protein
MTNKCDENNPIVMLGVPCNYTSCTGSYKKGKRIVRKEIKMFLYKIIQTSM